MWWPGSPKVVNSHMRWPVWVFREGRADNFFTLHQIIEERRISLVGIGKTFNRLNRGKLWEDLDKTDCPNHLISLLKGNKTRMELGGWCFSQIFINQWVRWVYTVPGTVYLEDALRELKKNPGILLTNNVNSAAVWRWYGDIRKLIVSCRKTMYELKDLNGIYHFKISPIKTKLQFLQENSQFDQKQLR